MKRIITLIIIAASLFFPRPAEAACNFHQLMTSASKDVTNFTSTCTITGVEGVDNPQNTETSTTTNASLTLGTNSAITINNGGTLAVNSLSINAGTIAIQTGGQIKLNIPLYVADADADGYPVDFTLYLASASGRRRLGLMRDFTTVDCGDSTYATDNVCCAIATRYQDADGDGYGNPGVSISACTTAGYVDDNTDCNDTGTNAANVRTSATCYTDADNDDYGVGTAKTCITGGATCATATWASGGQGTAATSGNFAANATDCQDTGTNANLVWVAPSVACYVDADNDDYGDIRTTVAAIACGNNATCASLTAHSNGTTVTSPGYGSTTRNDCRDASATVKPGSTTCGTASFTKFAANGTSDTTSFDYNCSSTAVTAGAGEVACGTARNYASAGTTPTWAATNDGDPDNNNSECSARNSTCAAGSMNKYVPASIGCGGAGYAGCAATTTQVTSCITDGCYGPTTSTFCYSPGGYGTQACQ